MKDTDIDNVYAIETSVHVAPWSRNILRDCVLVGYDCRILEINDEHNSQVVGGYIIARIADNACHILNFCIAKPFQAKGWGRKFLETFIHSLSEDNRLASVVLEVRPSNNSALHLYQTMGFEQVEIKKEYYKDKNGIEDGILLKKQLKSE